MRCALYYYYSHPATNVLSRSEGRQWIFIRMKSLVYKLSPVVVRMVPPFEYHGILHPSRFHSGVGILNQWVNQETTKDEADVNVSLYLTVKERVVAKGCSEGDLFSPQWPRFPL
jgi:hypothetical protein